MASLARCLCRSVTINKLHPCFTTAARLISYIVQPSAEEGTALDMIKYAKSHKADEPSYSEAVRILQQGLSFFSTDGRPSGDMASGRLQLSLATIHANMSNFQDATDCLQQLLNSKSAPLIAKGAALEALTALCLQMHQDKAAMDHADSFKKLWEEETAKSSTPEHSEDIKYQALALRRLAELANPSSHAEFMDSEASLTNGLKNVSGSAVLAFAEASHVHGLFPLAKDLYKRAIILSKEELESSTSSLSAVSMVPEAVHVGALAGLGQLLTVMGNFEEAELQLTQALKETEKVKGEKHPQIGVILACIGNLYQQRGMDQGSNKMFLTEGMYKSALDLMKAPPLDSGMTKNQSGRFGEIVALTRARLGAILVPALDRHSEVEKLKDWVETNWRSSRPLPELLHLKRLLSRDSELIKEDKSSRGETSVVNVRLERVLYR